MATVTGYTKARTDTLLAAKIATADRGVANGVAALDATGKVPPAQLPTPAAADGATAYPSVADTQFKDWTVNPFVLATNSTNANGSGRLLFARIRARKAATWNGLGYAVRTAGTGFTNYNGFGLYDATGALITQTADLATDLGTTGFKTAAFTAPRTVAQDEAYYIGLLFNATTQPGIAGFVSDTLPGLFVSLGTAGSRFAYIVVTAATVLPATFTPATATANTTVPFFGTT